MSQSSRPVVQVGTPEPVVEGAGVHLRRSIGTRGLDHLDPFLLLDHFESVNPADYEAGFPYHPHRGIETVTDGGATIRVIAGEAGDGRLVGPVEGLAVAPKFVDVRLPPGTTFRETVPRGHTTFAYVDQGVVRFGPEQTAAQAPALVVFGDGDVVEASAGPGGGGFLLAAARPLHEPIARYGPFVMNTRAEIEQTLADLRTGNFIRKEPRDE